MIYRELQQKLLSLLGKYPAINITGPRQSGKTTLAKSIAHDYNYFSFENIDTRIFAQEDPRGFLNAAGKQFILDEVQHVPILFSYLQEILDSSNENGKVILLGSQSFLMNAHISQSLAGRVANLKLLPLSYPELKRAGLNDQSINQILFNGGYPRLYKEHLDPIDFFPHYIETYLERDVRLIKNIGSLHTFIRFIKLCAGRTGHVLNISALAHDAEISVNTAKSWLSVLEASYILFLVQPYTPNINRRLIKSPKLYFYDTGLACSLLNMEQKHQMEHFYMRGNLFENFIFSELIKSNYNKGLPANFYYLRDAKGAEIDCVIEKPDKHIFIEIKLSKTLSSAHLKNIAILQKEFSNTQSFLVYSGGTEPLFHGTQCVHWKNLHHFDF